MSEKDNGGPAFPRVPFDVNDYTGDGSEGMTLRDWFAGQWIAAGHHANLPARYAADQAYEVADAMLEARK